MYSEVYGYGLADASAATAAALGTSRFPDVPFWGEPLYDWNLNAVSAPEVWNQDITGKGIVVAVIDTGIDYIHPDLINSIWQNPGEVEDNIDNDRNGFVDDLIGWDFINDDNNPFSNIAGHGSHVAGTITGDLSSNTGVQGVAPDALVMPIQVLSDEGSGNAEVLAAGIYYAVDNGANVINMSLGFGDSPEYSDSSVSDAVQYAYENNCIVVMAAGNEEWIVPGFPANLATRYGIAVGAVDYDNVIPLFSNWAGEDQLDYVLAPGVDVYSSWPDVNYEFLPGTSMASPHVAAIAALVWSANRSLSADRVKDLIIQTASDADLSAEYPDGSIEPVS
jgi:subtilisin family serine protease